jgi:mono/diheme cytochrome c family protein
MIGKFAACLAAMLLASGASLAQSPVERGSYLVNTIMTCGNCHSPKGPPDVVAGKDFSGGLRFDEPPFDVTASNITPDKETGIGRWSDADIKKALLDGVRPNGVQLAEVMPTNFYRILIPSDLNAIVAYLRTVKPVSNTVLDPIYKMALPHVIFPGAEKPFAQRDLNDKVKRGFYLATIGHCMECHTPMTPAGVVEFGNSLGKGGREFPGPWGISKSVNITSHRTAGIGAWSDAEIKRAITQGVSRDGRTMLPPMGYDYYAKMTDADLDAVVAYLRTVPGKE